MASSLAQQDSSILEIGSVVKKGENGSSTSSSRNTSPTSQSSYSILSSFGSIIPTKPSDTEAVKVRPIPGHDWVTQHANDKPQLSSLCDIDESILELGPLSVKPYIKTEFSDAQGSDMSLQSTELLTLIRDAANRAFLTSLLNLNSPAIVNCAGKHPLTKRSPWVRVCTKNAFTSPLALEVQTPNNSNLIVVLPELDLATTETQLEKMVKEIEDEGVAVHEAIRASEGNGKYSEVEYRIPLPPREEGIQFEEYAAFSRIETQDPAEEHDMVSLTPAIAICPWSIQELPSFGTRLEECSNTIAGLLDATLQPNRKEPLLLEWLDISHPSDLDTLIGNAENAGFPLDFPTVQPRWPIAPATHRDPCYLESEVQVTLKASEENEEELDISQKTSGEVAFVKLPSQDYGITTQEAERSDGVVYNFSDPLFSKSISGLPIAPVDKHKISQIEDALDILSRELRGLDWALYPELDLASTAEQMQWLKETIDTRTSAADSHSFSPKKNAGTPYVNQVTRSYAPMNADAYVQYHVDTEGVSWFFAEARTYWAWKIFALRDHWALFGRDRPTLQESNPATVLRQLLNLPEKPVIAGNTQCLYGECEDEAPPLEKHHINFFGQWCHEKSGTPPAVSLWAASVGQRFEVDENTPLHDAVISSQASKRIDPVHYDGDVSEIPDLKGDELRKFLEGNVHTTYAPFGSWQYDEYAEDENCPRHITGRHLEAQFDGNGQLQACHGLHLPRYMAKDDDDDINVNDDGAGRHPSSTKLKKLKGFDTRGGSPLRIAHAAPAGAPTFVVNLDRKVENQVRDHQDTHRDTNTLGELSGAQASYVGDESSEADTIIEVDGPQETRTVALHVNEMVTNADSPPSHAVPTQHANHVATDNDNSTLDEANSATTGLIPDIASIIGGQDNATKKVVDAFGKIAPNDPDVPQWYKDYMKAMEGRYAAQQEELKAARIGSAATTVTPMKHGRHISAEKMLATPMFEEADSPAKCLGSWEQNENGDFFTPTHSPARATTYQTSSIAAEPVRRTALMNLRTAKNVMMLKRIFPDQDEAKTSGLPSKRTAKSPIQINKHLHKRHPLKKSESAALHRTSLYSEDYGSLADDEMVFTSRSLPSSDWLRRDIFKGYEFNKPNDLKPALQTSEKAGLIDIDVFNDVPIPDDDRSETVVDKCTELRLAEHQSAALSPIMEKDSQDDHSLSLWAPKQRVAVKSSRYPVVKRNVSRIRVPSLEPFIVEDEEACLSDHRIAPMSPETEQELALQMRARLAGIRASAIWDGESDDEDDQIEEEEELSLEVDDNVLIVPNIKEQVALHNAAKFAGPRQSIGFDDKAGDEEDLGSHCGQDTNEEFYDGQDVSSPSSEKIRVSALQKTAVLAGTHSPVFWDRMTYDVTESSSKSTSPTDSLFSMSGQESRSSSVSAIPFPDLNADKKTADKEEVEKEENEETSGLVQAGGVTAPDEPAPASRKPHNLTFNFYTAASIPPSCTCSKAFTTTLSNPPALLTGVPMGPGDILEMENSTGYPVDVALIPNRRGGLTVNSLADLGYVGWRIAKWIIGW